MRDFLDTHKPAASARLHLLMASALWTAVGATLLFFGGRWTLVEPLPHAGLLVAAAVAVGLLKGRFVLDRTAVRIAERIKARGGGRCIGGFLSLRSWAFVLVMVAAGRLLRGGLLPHAVVGLLYLAIGTALLLATRRLWRAWYHHSPEE